MASPARKNSRSGNPAKRAAVGPVSSASAWRGRNADGEDLSLPSGNVARVKRPGPGVLLAEGLLPDSLTAIVSEAVQSKRGISKKQLSTLATTMDAIGDMMDAMDRTTAIVVLEPRCLYHRRETESGEWETIPLEEREDPDCAIYTDEVDMEDKFFIFQFAVGGTRDWERFRRESGAIVGDLGTGEDVPGQTE